MKLDPTKVTLVALATLSVFSVVACGDVEIQRGAAALAQEPSAPAPGQTGFDHDLDTVPDHLDFCSGTVPGAIVWADGEWAGCAEGQVRDHERAIPSDPYNAPQEPRDDGVAPDPPEESTPVPPPVAEPNEDSVPEPEPEPEPQPEPPPVACDYPNAGSLTSVGSIMPRITWNGAYLHDGSTLDFDLESFYCDPEWAAYESVSFILVAEWCGACKSYLQALDLDRIDQNGGLVVIVDVETGDYRPPSNDRAHDYISGYIGSARSLRVGEGGASPSGVIYNSPIWSSMPNAFVVRKHDMQVIASQETAWSTLPFAEIAADPDANWTNL